MELVNRCGGWGKDGRRCGPNWEEQSVSAVEWPAIGRKRAKRNSEYLYAFRIIESQSWRGHTGHP